VVIWNFFEPSGDDSTTLLLSMYATLEALAEEAPRVDRSTAAASAALARRAMSQR
jgi:hypothetical protein